MADGAHARAPRVAGLSAALIAPLVREWLEPLCASLPSVAAAHSGLDHHKAATALSHCERPAPAHS